MLPLKSCIRSTKQTGRGFSPRLHLLTPPLLLWRPCIATLAMPSVLVPLHSFPSYLSPYSFSVSSAFLSAPHHKSSKTLSIPNPLSGHSFLFSLNHSLHLFCNHHSKSIHHCHQTYSSPDRHRYLQTIEQPANHKVSCNHKSQINQSIITASPIRARAHHLHQHHHHRSPMWFRVFTSPPSESSSYLGVSPCSAAATSRAQSSRRSPQTPVLSAAIDFLPRTPVPLNPATAGIISLLSLSPHHRISPSISTEHNRRLQLITVPSAQKSDPSYRRCYLRPSARSLPAAAH